MCSLVDELNVIDVLISDLSQSLASPDREAFRREALAAMAGLQVIGDGVLYRTFAPLQAHHFTPPSDERAGFDIANGAGPGLRPSKLIDKPPIECDLGPGGRPLKAA
jgi:hypothetical protein